MSDAPLLEVVGINVAYNDLQVLWDFSIKVNDGEMVALIGPNGSGKTTALNAIFGILRPNSGFIKFLGKRIDGLPPWRIAEMGMGYIPQGRRLFPQMSVLENLEMGAIRMKGSEREKALELVFELFPILKERRNQLAGTLSGGEQQMLTIARGLMMRPKLLLIDEPSYGLAPALVSKLFKTLRTLNDQGLTLLLVEQNIHVLRNAHRGYVLENGRIIMEGEGRKLMENEDIKRAYLTL